MRNKIASLLPGAGPAAEPWSPEQAARFAARRDYLFVKLLLKDRAALAAAREEGLVGSAQCGVEMIHEECRKALWDWWNGWQEEEEPSPKPKRTRKKTDARKAIERAKLEAKHAKRAEAAAAANATVPVTCSAGHGATGAAAAAATAARAMPQQPKQVAAAASTPSGTAPISDAQPMEQDSPGGQPELASRATPAAKTSATRRGHSAKESQRARLDTPKDTPGT